MWWWDDEEWMWWWDGEKKFGEKKCSGAMVRRNVVVKW